MIGAFSREIDRADKFGSGMRNMMQYGKRYGGADPQLIEGDVFRMVISVPEFGKARGGQSRAQSEAQSHAVLTALTEGPRSAADLVEVLQLGTKTRKLRDTPALQKAHRRLARPMPVWSGNMPHNIDTARCIR